MAAPLRVHLESLARRGDLAAQAELAAVPKLPPYAAHLWRHFQDLCQDRRYGEGGPQAISRLDLQAWERDEGVSLDYWERRALLNLDRLWRRVMTAAEDAPTEQP